MRYVETSHIKIADVEAKLEGANQLIDDYIFEVGLKDKDQLRLKLLCEEVLRLAKSIIGLGIMDCSCIVLTELTKLCSCYKCSGIHEKW